MATANTSNQTRNQGGAQGTKHLKKFFSPPLDKCVGHGS